MKSGEAATRNWREGTTPAVVTGEEVVIQVPNKYVARLVQMGMHALRVERRRVARRKAERNSRRRNRSK